MENRIGYIYKITSPNGKNYIGQTVNIRGRKSCYRKNKFQVQIKLWNSCQAHNWNPIDTFEIIEECLCGKDKIILNEREIYWISFYDSFYNGLNCNKGGGGRMGHKHSEETKRKMSIAATGHEVSQETKDKIGKENKGKKRLQEVKNKMSETRKGKNNNFYGKKHSKETIEKISNSNKGKCAGSKNGMFGKTRPDLVERNKKRKK